MSAAPIFLSIGAVCFGVVIGWTTYFIMRRAQPTALTDLSTIIGALGGAAILNLFDARGPLFGFYAIGLAVGFFAYFFIFLALAGRAAVSKSLIEQQKRASLMGKEGQSGQQRPARSE